MKFSILFSLIFCVFSCQTTVINDDKDEKKALKRYDRPDASILRGVEIPEGASFFFSSGLVAPVLDESAEVNTLANPDLLIEVEAVAVYPE